ncbi:MAG: non-canonical purine NTP diphosphatase [Prevotella sp.]|nr:non-canonical purine NTP diphosphatase [Prevotella sp.]
MKIVFATNNQHKLEEIRQILGPEFEILSLNDIGCHDDIPEKGKTLEENARLKAEYVWEHYGSAVVFADDTGLEVEALDGEPGIFSARYAALDGNGSESHDSEANMKKLLRKLEGKDNRRARFRTVIALIESGNKIFFEGIVNGQIAREKSGHEGFGYDPIFIPDGYDKSFAELGADVKNSISHRARAVAKLAEYLKKQKL